MNKLKVEYLPLDKLKPYKNNAKLHPAEQIEQIKKSIEKFGFNDPIAVWGDDTIIEGHGRLIAAQELGIEKVPVIRLDSLTDEERKAYTLVHNKLTMNSGFSFDVLSEELDSLFNFDMSEFGFEGVNIESFFDDEDIEPVVGGEEEIETHRVEVVCNTAREFKILLTFLKKQALTYSELDDAG